MRRTVRPGVAGAALLGACGACLAVAAACSSNGGGTGGNFNGGDGGGSSSGGGNDGAAPVACTSTDALQIHFAPMYSAYLTDGTGVQRFQVPAVLASANRRA